MRTDSRQKSLNGIRQIADAASGYHGLLREFYVPSDGEDGLVPVEEVF
jgi:hypothetical protein